MDLNKELGFGGHYLLENGEHATGVSLMIDSLMRTSKKTTKRKVVYIPFGIDWTKTTDLRNKGFKLLHALSLENDIFKEAKRLECSHILFKEKIVPLLEENKND